LSRRGSRGAPDRPCREAGTRGEAGNLRRLSYTSVTHQAHRPCNCGREKEITMSIAKVTEIIADSPKSFEDAVASGIKRANKTLKNIRGAWVRDHEVVVDEKGNITQFRVKMKVTFVLTDKIN
jgi:dodecin